MTFVRTALLAAPLLALVLLRAITPAAAQTETLRFNLALAPAGSDAALFLAKHKGWFRDAGLDLRIEEGRGSMGAIQLVATGQIDVGQGELGPMIVAIDKGAPILSIAGWARKTDLSIFVDRDSPIRHARDLKGKSVALIANSPWTPILDPFLKHVGLTRGDVDLRVVDSAALFTTYSSRRVDAMMSVGPYVMPIVDPVRPSRTLDLADYGIVSPGTGIIVARATLAAKRTALGRFIKEQIRAWNDIFAGRQDEAVEAIIKENPNARLNARVLRAQIDAYEPYFYTPATKGKPIGWQAEEDWNEAIRSFREAGLLKGQRQPSDFYTNALVDAAGQ